MAYSSINLTKKTKKEKGEVMDIAKILDRVRSKVTDKEIVERIECAQTEDSEL